MFRYELNFWDEYNDSPEFEKGFIAAKSYSEAADKVIEYYGKENIIDIKLYALEDILTDEDIRESCE